MARSRRDFTPEYKDEAVRLVLTTGRAVATVARELGINEATLGRWVTAFKARNKTGQTEVTESERRTFGRCAAPTAKTTLVSGSLASQRSAPARIRRAPSPEYRLPEGHHRHSEIFEWSSWSYEMLTILATSDAD
ncbi:transposase [Cryobacterium adonitolivorans]|nr:transposase [Cryobacterium adonitolivorans]